MAPNTSFSAFPRTFTLINLAFISLSFVATPVSCSHSVKSMPRHKPMLQARQQFTDSDTVPDIPPAPPPNSPVNSGIPTFGTVPSPSSAFFSTSTSFTTTTITDSISTFSSFLFTQSIPATSTLRTSSLPLSTSSSFSTSFASSSSASTVTSQSLNLIGIPTTSIPITTLIIGQTSVISPNSTPTFVTQLDPTSTNTTNSSSTSSSGFWNNKAAVAATFAVSGSAILIGLIIIGVCLRRKRNSLGDEDFFTGPDPEPEPALSGTGSHSPSMAEITAPATENAYQDRQVYYQSAGGQYTKDHNYYQHQPATNYDYGYPSTPYDTSNTYRDLDSAHAYEYKQSTGYVNYPTTERRIPAPYDTPHPYASPGVVPSHIPPTSNRRQSYDSFYGYAR